MLAAPGWAFFATDLVYSAGSSTGRAGNACVGGRLSGVDLRCLSGRVKARSGTVLLMVRTLIGLKLEKSDEVASFGGYWGAIGR